MPLKPAQAWFLAFTAVFAVLAGIVFWGTGSPNVAFVAPDDGVLFSRSYRDTLLNWWNMFAGSGKAHPLDLLWSGLVVSPLFCSELKYVVPVFLSSIALMWFLRGRGLSRAASYGAGLFLGFSGYWLTLFSAGHGNWFVWMSYGVFAFGLVDRAVTRRGLRYWILLGLSVAWASFYMPDVWLLFSVFTAAYLVFCLTRECRWRKFPIVGTIVSVSVFLLVGAPGIYHAFVNDLASRDSQIEQSKGTVLGGGDRDESESRWIFVTNWSMPPEDTLEFLVPRIHGDTSCPLTLSINRERGIVPYTGRLGRPVGSREGNYRQHSLYVGFVTCLFAVCGCIGAFRRREDRRTVLFFACSALMFYLFSLGRYCELVYRCIYSLPFGDYMRAPVKWHHLTEFCIVVLAGYGIDFVLKTIGNRKLSRWAVLIVVAIGACNLAYEAHIYCAPVDYSKAVDMGCSAQLTVATRQQLMRASDMIRAGRIVPVAYWLGSREAMLVQILEPLRPVQSNPIKPLPLCLGVISVLSAIIAVSLSVAEKRGFLHVRPYSVA